MAKSQKLDWAIVDLKNFGVTVFSYQNKVGNDFKPFGETKKEFATPGTSTMKAGGEIRVGALSFGVAHSLIANTVDTNVNFFTAPGAGENYFGAQDANFSATQNEASATLAMPKLLPDVQGPISNLLPNLWASVSDKQSLQSGFQTATAAGDTISTSFGSTWNWKNGYATVGYWNYSGNNVGVGDTWTGSGLDANLGFDHSSFGIYAGLSYGRSETNIVSWQSAGALYNYYLTVAYKPDEQLPSISVTAAAGKYDYNAITYSLMSTDLYTIPEPDSSGGTYTSFGIGLDLTNWLWHNQNSQHSLYPSVKLLYRYSKNAFFYDSAPVEKDDNLIAMMVQGKF